MHIDPEVSRAHARARAVRSRAHAPYSKFRVGAALKLKNVEGAVAGCNVENASFGACVCAERSAVVRAVSRFGAIDPEFLVVVTDEPGGSVPCALCLQVLAEFCADDMPVYLGDLGGVRREMRFRDLLPQPFRAFSTRDAT